MAGQNHHFSQYAPEKIPYAIDRYVKETNRLYGVLNRRLADRAFIRETTPSLILRPTHGSFPTNVRDRNWRIFPTLSDGSKRSDAGQRQCGLTTKRCKSIPSR